MRRSQLILRGCVLILLGTSPAVRASDWPQFRGPSASGVVPGGFPTRFGPGTNELWSVAVPPGNSSPVIVEDQIFLTAHEGDSLWVLAYDRIDGRESWRRSLPPGTIERGARLGSPATATPAVAGDSVVVYFGPFGLACFDRDGAERWRLPLPVPVTQHGAGTSPVIAGDLVLLNSDQDVASHLLAVDLGTGRIRWRTERPHALRGFSTPLPWPPEKPRQVVVAGTLRLDAYDLVTGKPAWHVNGLPNEMVSSPIPAGDRIVIAGWTAGPGVRQMPAWDDLIQDGDKDGDGQLSRDEAPAGPARQHFAYLDADKDGRLSRSEYVTAAHAFDASRNVAMSVRPGGSGDVTATHVDWTLSRGLPYCPSPIWIDGRVYLLRNGGLLTCLDARSGKVHFQEERIGALGDNYASPIGSEDKVCVFSQPGVGVVLKVSDTLEVLAMNPLGDPVVATPALSRGRLYVRSATRLWAFGKP